jgi:hypothetical protein
MQSLAEQRDEAQDKEEIYARKLQNLESTYLQSNESLQAELSGAQKALQQEQQITAELNAAMLTMQGWVKDARTALQKIKSSRAQDRSSWEKRFAESEAVAHRLLQKERLTVTSLRRQYEDTCASLSAASSELVCAQQVLNETQFELQKARNQLQAVSEGYTRELTAARQEAERLIADAIEGQQLEQTTSRRKVAELLRRQEEVDAANRALLQKVQSQGSALEQLQAELLSRELGGSGVTGIHPYAMLISQTPCEPPVGFFSKRPSIEFRSHACILL